jgi:hypothetical protein
MTPAEREELKRRVESYSQSEWREMFAPTKVLADLLAANEKMRDLLRDAIGLIPLGYKTRNEIASFLAEK